MSDISLPHCSKCGLPEYACACDELREVEPGGSQPRDDYAPLLVPTRMVAHYVAELATLAMQHGAPREEVNKRLMSVITAFEAMARMIESTIVRRVQLAGRGKDDLPNKVS